jgi:hypothetical protein
MFARQAVSRLFFGRHFLHPDKFSASRFPLSGHHSKMRFTPKIPHATIPLYQNKRDSGPPHAIVIASRLHYVILLMRLVASDNISIKQ